MKLLQVNYTDLPGKRFNGYDLNMALRKDGIDAKQIVLKKYSNSEDSTVFSMKTDTIMHGIYRWMENKLSVNNVLYPYGKQFMGIKDFIEADIIHYHILHRFMFSLFDYPQLMNSKKTVWTIHDPWIITGNCVHPLDCGKWRTGCGKCKRLKETGFEMNDDHTEQMWKIKRNVLKQINPHIIVSTKFMERYLKCSPLTNHFDKIHIIPFGVNVADFQIKERTQVRSQYKIQPGDIVIGFRSDTNPIKGCFYIYEALKKLDNRKNIVLVTVGNGTIPEDINKRYKIQNLGWVNETRKIADFLLICDIFLMPSLAESFGIMAIESMAAETPVICFDGTTVEEIVNAPRCGLSVPFKSSGGLAKAIKFLMDNPNIRLKMAKQSRKRICEKYNFNDYVYEHEKLYYEILDNR